jgi:hypothetical protein
VQQLAAGTVSQQQCREPVAMTPGLKPGTLRWQSCCPAPVAVAGGPCCSLRVCACQTALQNSNVRPCAATRVSPRVQGITATWAPSRSHLSRSSDRLTDRNSRSSPVSELSAASSVGDVTCAANKRPVCHGRRASSTSAERHARPTPKAARCVAEHDEQACGSGLCQHIPTVAVGMLTPSTSFCSR